MPALDFPSSPTNGQVFGQYTYDSTKGAWRVTSNSAMAVVPSATPPTSPVAGNLWLNTNDGVLFVYYDDGNSAQWVEVKSNTASGSTVAARVDALEAKPNGLVPITPSSVTVNSGTATVGSSGLVSFTGVSTIKLFNAFPAGYTRFLITFYSDATMGGDAFMQLMDSAGTVANSSYEWKIVYGDYGVATPGVGNNASAPSMWVSYNSGAFGGIASSEIKIQNPNVAKRTVITVNGSNNSSTVMGAAYHNVATAYPGMAMYWTTASPGAIQVYGYR